ncbi:MAG TPA: hypothetical protein ENK23_02455 [Sorangium sp.]|nr:hypothetical protein [Sorangium sp.]
MAETPPSQGDNAAPGPVTHAAGGAAIASGGGSQANANAGGTTTGSSDAKASEGKKASDKIAETFGKERTGEAKQGCKCWVKIHFKPDPPQPLPNEQKNKPTFSYDYVLRDVNDKIVKKGVLDLRNGSKIEVKDICCGVCQLKVKFPGGVWKSIKLATDRLHRYLIINELWEAAKYMAKEMNTNASSWNTKVMRASNTVGNAALLAGNLAPKLVAYGELVERTGPGRPWDHKLHFSRKKMGKTTPGAWHTWGHWEYFRDPWSNMHFGYIGRAAGFSRTELVGGASLAQWLDDKRTGKPASADPPQDTAAINAGYNMRGPITPEMLIREIENNPKYQRRPHSYESATAGRSIQKVKSGK